MIITCFSILGDNSGAFWTMMTFIAIAISFFFIIRQIKLQNNANMMNFINSSDEKWRSDKFRKIRNKVCSKSTDKIDIDEESLLSFFEDLGLLYEKNMINLDLIWEKFSYYIENYWIILEQNIRKIQNDKNDITWFQNFEKLHKAIFKYSIKKTKNKKYKISDKDLNKFKKSEIR